MKDYALEIFSSNLRINPGMSKLILILYQAFIKLYSVIYTYTFRLLMMGEQPRGVNSCVVAA